MASIMKRGNTYSVRYNYKDHAGKPCKGWETFKTKAEAQERKITVEKELLDGTFLVPDSMTVEEMLYKWIPIQSSKHKWSPKTYTQSVAMVQNLIVPYIGKRKVQDLRTYDIEQFYATLSQTPCGQYVHGEKQELTENQKKRLLSSTSIHEVHTLLKTAFSYAVDWDLIHKSPTPREAPKINTEERTIWDERTMLAALQTIENPALHLAVHMSMILSLREGEILGLQPGDLDFDAADGRGTISVNKAMQRADKVALSKIDPSQIYHTFPDRREGSKSSLILKKTKTKKSNRVLYMTKPLKEELLAWLDKMKQDEQNAPEKYSNCGQLFRLPDGLPIAPDVLTKWYRQWRAEHPEFEKIVFHGLRHSSATYQLLQSGGDFKSVQGNTGHATATVLMDTYAHTQDKPRLELTEKIEADFYSQDVAGAKPQEPPENKTPVATKITGKMILEAIRQMDAEVILIFITNMAQYAIRGYSVGALDYVLKPVPYFAFSQQLMKAVTRLEKRAKRYLTVPVEGGLRRLDTASIYYLESEGHRVHFYTDEGDFSAPGALKTFEEKLAACPFARCNSGYLVNLAQVRELRQSTVQVGPCELQVSRPKRKAFLAALTDYIGGEGS